LCFEEANGLAVAYCYFTTDPQQRSVSGCISKEARRIAIGTAA